jgi:hypothetical protein
MPTKILYAFLFSLIRATCPAHLILLDLEKSTTCEVPHYAVFSNLPSICYNLTLKLSQTQDCLI